VQNFIQATFDNPPFTRTVTISNPSFSNPAGGTDTPSLAPPSVTSIGSPMNAPTVQQWSLGVQQQVLRSTVVGVSYVGSHGTHLMHLVNVNNPLPGVATQLKVNVNAVRPYLGWGTINTRETTGVSNYHSLQVTANRRMVRGFTLGLAYTWAKSIDIASSDYFTGDLAPDEHNFARERGPSDFDRTHVLNISGIWALPKIVRDPVLAPVLNGWQLSGIARFNAGKPFDVLMSSDAARARRNSGSTATPSRGLSRAPSATWGATACAAPASTSGTWPCSRTSACLKGSGAGSSARRCLTPSTTPPSPPWPTP